MVDERIGMHMNSHGEAEHGANLADGGIFILVAPSGAGKSSLIFRLLEDYPHSLALSCSHTTRPPRRGEREGLHYHFVTEKEFRHLQDEHAFLEWAQVHEHYYGTTYAQLRKMRQQGKKVIIEVDIQGLKSIKEREPHIAALFIFPPSAAEMECRLRGRGSDSDSSIKVRLRSAQKEISEAHRCDYYMVNEDFDVSVDLLRKWIIEGEVPAMPRTQALDLMQQMLVDLQQTLHAS